MTQLDFWYDFASPYAYMAAMRIEKLAAEAGGEGVTLRWRPFIIGPLFKEFGHDLSPVFDNQVKWRYLLADVPRQAAYYGVPMSAARLEGPVPSMLGARVALLLASEGEGEGEGEEDNLCPPFTRALYQASFAEGRNIAEPEVVAAVLEGMGADAKAVIARALTAENKQALKDQVAAAMAAGLFGIPSYTIAAKDNELFWGNDRLEQAIAAAAV
jgi:2-hydroxychromene-2-carboxylate isomerase